MLRDIRFALRTLGQQRLVTTMVVLCLALVVAGNTTVFSIVRSYLIKPLPYRDVERLALVVERERGVVDSSVGLSVPSYRTLREQNRTLERLSALSSSLVNLTGDGAPQQLEVQLSTPDFLPMLGIAPVAGRLFGESDGVPGGGQVALLTFRLWQDRFGGDPAAIGRTLLLDREPYQVIGVLPEDFEYINWQVDLWLPLVIDPSDDHRETRAIGHLVAKIAPGVTADAAREDISRLWGELEKEFPETSRGYEMSLSTFREQFPGPTDRKLFTLIQGAGLFVLLIACANISNLLLARGQRRRRELALRSALGAGRNRILRQLLTENVVLSLAGGVIGMALALALIRYLKQSLAGTLPRFILPEVDLWVLGFSIGISAGAGLLFGLVPSLQALRGRFGDALREGGSRGALGVRSLASSVFVIAEVALTLTLLCGAGLLLRTFLEVQYGDPGFDSDRLLTFGIALPEDEYPSAEQRIAFHDRLLAQLDTIPSVELAASTLALPRSRGVPIDTVEIEGRDLGDASAPRASWLAVSPDYLEALRIPLLRGRGLESSDRADALPVVVVDEDFVTRFLSPDDRDGQSLGNGSVIGERIVFQGESREIVGVARSVRQRRIGSIDGPTAQVYVPFAQAPRRATSYVVKVAIGEPEGLAGPVRDAVWSIDPNLPVADLMTLDEHIAIQLSGLDVFTGIIAGFSGFALILAALGVYGVLAYSVAQRTQEIGVRMALGARRREIIAMVLRQGAILTAIGLAIGVPMVWGVEKMVASALSGLSVVAGPTIAWVALVLVVTAAVASLLPARRASGIAPTVALRQE